MTRKDQFVLLVQTACLVDVSNTPGYYRALYITRIVHAAMSVLEESLPEDLLGAASDFFLWNRGELERSSWIKFE